MLCCLLLDTAREVNCAALIGRHMILSVAVVTAQRVLPYTHRPVLNERGFRTDGVLSGPFDSRVSIVV